MARPAAAANTRAPARKSSKEMDAPAKPEAAKATKANTSKKATKAVTDVEAAASKAPAASKKRTAAHVEDESNVSRSSKRTRTVAEPEEKKAVVKKTAAKAAPKAAAKKVEAKAPAPKKAVAATSKKPAAVAKKASPKKETKVLAPKVTRVEKVKVVKAPKPKTIVNTAPTVERRTFVMGEGSAGELGLGATKGACNVARPRLNKILEEMGIVDLAVGGMHCVALTKDNKILTWGVNDNKALGRPLPAWSAREIGEDDDSDEDDEGLELNPYEAMPTAIPQEYFPEDTVFTQVAAGDSTSFVVTEEGFVYGWGTFRNNEGVWGFTADKDGNLVKEQKLPLLIPHLKNIKSVTCGDNHALAIDNKGVIYGWGSGQQDQLGRRIVARHAEKNLIPAPVPLPKKAKVTDVIAGPNHSFAIEKDGGVYAWGLNNFAQTGIPYAADKDNDIVTAPTKVSALADHKITTIGTGANHSVALTSNGDLLSFGRLENFALGIKFDHILDDESLVRKNEHNKPKVLLQPMRVEIAEPVSAIACGPDHNIAVTREGKAYAWGFNANMQCGVGAGREDDVKMPEVLHSKSMEGVAMDWAGCGGQFSMIGARKG